MLCFSFRGYSQCADAATALTATLRLLFVLADVQAPGNAWAAASFLWLLHQPQQAAECLLSQPGSNTHQHSQCPDVSALNVVSYISQIVPSAISHSQSSSQQLAGTCSRLSTQLQAAGLPLLALEALQMAHHLSTASSVDAAHRKRASQLAALAMMATFEQAAAGESWAARQLQELQARGLELDAQEALGSWRRMQAQLHHRCLSFSSCHRHMHAFRCQLAGVMPGGSTEYLFHQRQHPECCATVWCMARSDHLLP